MQLREATRQDPTGKISSDVGPEQRYRAKDMKQNHHEVAEAVQSAVRGLLESAENAALLPHLQSSLGISRLQIEEGCLHYTLQSFESDNDIYANVATHVAMWIEYQAARGIHARRQSVILNELRRWRPSSLADIGFGAPTQYLRDYVLPSPGVKATLLDKYAAAIEVGQSILSYWGATSSRDVSFALHDMDVDPPIPDRDCYLMLDSIEHAAHPEAYLRATTAVARQGALFLFHMPIGPQIPSHSIAWNSNREATLWLASTGLEVASTEVILPNAEVDLFARHEVKMINLFVVAHKR